MNEKEISDFVIERFKKIQSDKVLNKERSKAVHVSNLTASCMRKSWYDFHQPEAPVDYPSICNFFLG